MFSKCTTKHWCLMKRPTLCKFFLKGNCRNGSNCPFSHAIPERYMIDPQNQDYKPYFVDSRNIDTSMHQSRYNDQVFGPQTGNYTIMIPHRHDTIDKGIYSFRSQERKFNGQRNTFIDKSKYKWVAPSVRSENTGRGMHGEQNDLHNAINEDSEEKILSRRPGCAEENTESNTTTTEEFSCLCYTTMKDLSDSDRQQFEAAEFQYVPLLSPPRELCFNSLIL